MKLSICVLLIISMTAMASAGEIFGTIIDGNKAVPEGTKVEVTVAGKVFTGTIDKTGMYHVFAAEKGKGTLTAYYKDQKQTADVLNAFEDGAADITLSYFPGSYASLKEKASYQEVFQNLMRSSESLSRNPEKSGK